MFFNPNFSGLTWYEVEWKRIIFFRNNMFHIRCNSEFPGFMVKNFYMKRKNKKEIEKMCVIR